MYILSQDEKTLINYHSKFSICKNNDDDNYTIFVDGQRVGNYSETRAKEILEEIIIHINSDFNFFLNTYRMPKE